MLSSFDSFTKPARFDDLVQSVQHCNLCPRLCSRRKVLSPANGNIEAKVLFVAEAPGRLGAERTGVPLHGDRTGDNFEMLLGNVGWKREQVFITNAILCNPQEDNGNNATPTPEEIANCSAYLEMVIALVQPDVVATLGKTALEALELISPHGIEFQAGVARMVPWRDRKLFPLYHPGPRALIHRSLAKQRADFMVLAKQVDPVNGLIERRKRARKLTPLVAEQPTALQQAVKAVLEMKGRLTFFKLTKLLYLADLQALRVLGHAIAGEVYLRQVDGPWLPNLDKELKAMDGFEVRRFFAHNLPMVGLGPSPRFEPELDDAFLEILTEVVRKYGDLSNAAIKTAVYQTEPMRGILREERSGKDMRNKPVLYRDKAAGDSSAAS
jgi:uracil-DNA glycosylase family 4